MSDFDYFDDEEEAAIAAGDLIEVQSITGVMFNVMTDEEKRYFDDMSTRYLDDNRFTNITDLSDLDRVLRLELLCHRYQFWLTQEKDYWGNNVDPEELRKNIKEFSAEIGRLKKGLGLEKAQRDKDRGESLEARWNDLRLRAKQMGVMRNEQAVAVITLGMELIARIDYHNNCDEQERKELKVTRDDIWNWLNTEFRQKFMDIDEKFRATNQKYWVGNL